MMTQALRGACVLLWILSLVECEVSVSQVTCIFTEDCVLPCTFPPSSNVAILWYKQKVLLHTIVPGMGQLGNSSKVTSSQGQVTLSNGSLLLQHSGLRDRGLYQCRVNSTGEKQGSDIGVIVAAPIRAVSIELAENKLLCSTRGVYPAPLLQWGTDPPSKLDARLIITSMRANNQGLYDSESSLSLQEQSGPNRYVCTVRSKHGSQTWTASLEERDMSVAEGKPLLIPCVVPKNLENFTLTWMFTRTKGPTVILTYNSLTHQTSGPWDGQVAMDPDQVLLGNVSLRVLSPMNKDNVGHYTCTFSGFQTSYVIQTALTISTPQTDKNSTSTGWVIGVVVGLLALVIVGVVIHQKRKDRAKKRTKQDHKELEPMNTENSQQSPGPTLGDKVV